MKKTERITICVDSETKESFRILAEKSGVSMSALGRVMLNLGDLIKKTIEDSLSSISVPSMEVVQTTEESIWMQHKKKTVKKTVVGGYAKQMDTPLLNEIRKNPLYNKQKERHNRKPVILPNIRPPPDIQILESLVVNT